jgi:hypothetical protein
LYCLVLPARLRGSLRIPYIDNLVNFADPYSLLCDAGIQLLGCSAQNVLACCL